MFWRELVEHLESGERAFLALVADNTAHSPGTRGAKLFMGPDGETVGTVGGGIMEADILEYGEEALERAGAGDVVAESQRLYHRKKGKGEKSGLICAGHQTNVYYVVEPERDLPVLRDVVERVEADEPGLLIIDEDGMQVGGEEVITPERPPVRFVGETDGGWRYEQQLLNWKRAAIIGGGHCGLALSRVLAQLGYTVTNFETREDVFTFEENEYARHKIAVDDYAEAGEHIEHEEITHVIVMTADQPSDVRGLVGTIEGPYPYIGVMGSPAKLIKIREDLKAEGIDERHFERLYAPIGLEMTSNKPEEIAISIAAELLRERESLFPHSKPATPD